ncbi:hypothetical protein SGUI_0294 [Serinicoccus hydrothermalis]|uniref:DUF559 domain-containing protein n=1 Tax=Serinicoccus hydrothermalis TaxID=1758689 RepID=A0A1B1N8D0_9MICO|nr:hypothetical protein SGUI_0294 [Serinicoccus hydrothermalis]
MRAGMSKHTLDGPEFRRLLGSVRVLAEVTVTAHLLARAALLVAPDAVVSHHSAARLYGAVVPDSPRVHLTIGRAQDRRRRQGLQWHVDAAATSCLYRGIRVTTAAQTFLDLAHDLTLVDLVVLGDSLVHRGHASPNALVEAAESRGIPLARRAAALVRRGAESPMETKVRLLLVLAGFPEPRMQVAFVDRGGQTRYRLDLAYPELKVAIEYDGRHHAADPAQWGHDISRREWLDDQGWRLVVLRSPDVHATPWATVRRIAGILAAHGYDKPLPPVPPAAFAEHFPEQPWRSST